MEEAPSYLNHLSVMSANDSQSTKSQAIGEGFKLINRDNIVSTFTKLIASVPNWKDLMKAAEKQGSTYELAWRRGTTLDWITEQTTVEGHARTWAVISGMILKSVSHLFLLRLTLPTELMFPITLLADQAPFYLGASNRYSLPDQRSPSFRGEARGASCHRRVHLACQTGVWSSHSTLRDKSRRSSLRQQTKSSLSSRSSLGYLSRVQSRTTCLERRWQPSRLKSKQSTASHQSTQRFEARSSVWRKQSQQG